MSNLIAPHSAKIDAHSVTEAERLKGLLVTWLERVKSPYLDAVKARHIVKP